MVKLRAMSTAFGNIVAFTFAIGLEFVLEYVLDFAFVDLLDRKDEEPEGLIRLWTEAVGELIMEPRRHEVEGDDV